MFRLPIFSSGPTGRSCVIHYDSQFGCGCSFDTASITHVTRDIDHKVLLHTFNPPSLTNLIRILKVKENLAVTNFWVVCYRAITVDPNEKVIIVDGGVVDISVCITSGVPTIRANLMLSSNHRTMR